MNKDLLKAISVLEEILQSPRFPCDSTRCKDFSVKNKRHRERLIFEINCSYDSIYRAQKLIDKFRKNNESNNEST